MKDKRGFRFYLANFVAKSVSFSLKILGRNASYLPGYFALKIDPLFIKHSEHPKVVIAVTGTNGKTTTSNLLNDFLKAFGKRVSNNSLGSNTVDGIASIYVKNNSFLGKSKDDYAVLEVDERSSLKIFSQVEPDYLIVTNLFRDSYARNAHADYIFDFLNKSIPAKTKLILNSDDLISACLKPENSRTYYSVPQVDGIPEENDSRVKDLVNCPECQTRLKAKYIHYNHIGQYSCPNCSFENPHSNYTLRNVDLVTQKAEIIHDNEIRNIKLLSDNFVDLYNILAAYTVLNNCGFSLDEIARNTDSVKIPQSRNVHVTIGNTTLRSMLAKGNNPIATSRTLQYIAKLPGKKTLILANDKSHIGPNDFSRADCGWIYDNDYRPLLLDEFTNIICSGEKRYDFALRLLMEGIDENKITYADEHKDAPKVIDYDNADHIVILHDTGNEVELEKVFKDIERILKTRQRGL